MMFFCGRIFVVVVVFVFVFVFVVVFVVVFVFVFVVVFVFVFVFAFVLGGVQVVAGTVQQRKSLHLPPRRSIVLQPILH